MLVQYTYLDFYLSPLRSGSLYCRSLPTGCIQLLRVQTPTTHKVSHSTYPPCGTACHSLCATSLSLHTFGQRLKAWAPAGTGKGSTCPPPLPLKCCKVLCALVVTAKRSVYQLFMHYFHNFASASGGFSPAPHQGFTLDPAWGLYPGPHWGLSFPDPLSCPPLEKNLAGAHG